MVMTAIHPGKCANCKRNHIRPGDYIVRHKGTWASVTCIEAQRDKQTATDRRIAHDMDLSLWDYYNRPGVSTAAENIGGVEDFE